MPQRIKLPESKMFQAHGLIWLEPKHRLVKKLKNSFVPSVHGHKTWHSSFLMMDYLLHNPVRRSAPVLDLGCGWAPAGIFCATHFGSPVTGVDLDPDVFPYAEVLASLNDVELRFLHKGYDKLGRKVLGRHELLIGSDICFWDELVEPLDDLVRRAFAAGSKRVVIADPGRSPFHELAERLHAHAKVKVVDWYTQEPEVIEGEILDVRPRRKR